MSAQSPTAGLPPASDAELVRRYSDLVRRIARHLVARLPTSVDIADLIQSGVIGLLEAARNYSGAHGASFETYAGIRIRGAMLDELRRGDWAPRSVHRRLREIAAAMRAIEQECGREARDVEVAQRVGIPLDEYHRCLQDATQCQMLSINARDDDSDSFDAPSGERTPLEEVEREEFQHNLAEAIESLPEREKLVLSLYYDDELNLREIGAVLDVSESRVCQIHGQALLRLRARMTALAGAQNPA
ncbi:MAG: RNA polymerase sigma factor FliA [Nevskia sp.]|nr:RNA polymerase sigma factor FliA [Nevskia sp.]